MFCVVTVVYAKTTDTDMARPLDLVSIIVLQ